MRSAVLGMNTRQVRQHAIGASVVDQIAGRCRRCLGPRPHPLRKGPAALVAHASPICAPWLTRSNASPRSIISGACSPEFSTPHDSPALFHHRKNEGAFAHGEPSDRAYAQACMTMRRRQIEPSATVYPRGCGGLPRRSGTHRRARPRAVCAGHAPGNGRGATGPASPAHGLAGGAAVGDADRIPVDIGIGPSHIHRRCKRAGHGYAAVLIQDSPSNRPARRSFLVALRA